MLRYYRIHLIYTIQWYKKKFNSFKRRKVSISRVRVYVFRWAGFWEADWEICIFEHILPRKVIFWCPKTIPKIWYWSLVRVKQIFINMYIVLKKTQCINTKKQICINKLSHYLLWNFMLDICIWLFFITTVVFKIKTYKIKKF